MAAYNSPTNTYGIAIKESSNAVGTFKYGLKIENISGASSGNYAWYSNEGISRFGDNLLIHLDDKKILFGTGQDASITYDGTNLVINPKEIGSGNVTINGDLTTEGLTSSGGGSAGHVTCWKADGITIGYCSDAPDASGICTCLLYTSDAADE